MSDHLGTRTPDDVSPLPAEAQADAPNEDPTAPPADAPARGTMTWLIAAAAVVLAFLAIRALIAPAAPPTTGPGAGGAPTDPQALSRRDQLLNASLAAAQAGQWQSCIDNANEALSIDVRQARALNNLGFCQAQQGKLGDALRTLDAAIALDPSFTLARNNRAWVLGMRSGKP